MSYEKITQPQMYVVTGELKSLTQVTQAGSPRQNTTQDVELLHPQEQSPKGEHQLLETYNAMRLWLLVHMSITPLFRYLKDFFPLFKQDFVQQWQYYWLGSKITSLIKKKDNSRSSSKGVSVQRQATTDTEPYYQPKSHLIKTLETLRAKLF